MSALGLKVFLDFLFGDFILCLFFVERILLYFLRLLAWIRFDAIAVNVVGGIKSPLPGPLPRGERGFEVIL